jgi:hypothetical protein
MYVHQHPAKTTRGKGSNEPARRANIFHAGGTGAIFSFEQHKSSNLGPVHGPATVRKRREENKKKEY